MLMMLGLAAVAPACDADDMRSAVVKVYPTRYAAEANPSGLVAEFKGPDEKRPRIAISLSRVVSGVGSPTDIQFAPMRNDLMLVAEKGGNLKWFRLSDGKSGTLMTIKVLTDSEQGLLGLAFHPRFVDNGKFYVNYITQKDGKDITRVSEWQVPPGSVLEQATPRDERVVFEVVQPYANHNAGQLMFGPDGYLYLGLGDGGWANDPHKAGQNLQNYLGKMLRLDVDKPANGKGYGIPADNPFVGRSDALPELYAYGLRNPWRYSFAPDGRLVVADVGQDTWEEVSVAPKGGNLGWSLREAAHCFPPNSECKAEGFVEPIFEYSHEEGKSITGGYVYTGSRIPALAGKYVVGDFVAGKLWALDLPTAGAAAGLLASDKVFSLGRWPILIPTFGRDNAGELYVADFGAGVIYRLDPPVAAPATPIKG